MIPYDYFIFLLAMLVIGDTLLIAIAIQNKKIRNKAYKISIGILSLIIGLGICHILMNVEQDVDQNSMRYYPIYNHTYANGTKESVCITHNEAIIISHKFGAELPKNTIIKQWRMNPNKGLIDWKNGYENHYGYILPAEDGYKEAKIKAL